MAIITLPLPNVFSNGTTADATQVNADFNQITANVNANAAPLASPSFTGSATFGGSAFTTKAALTYGATTTINCLLSNAFRVVLAGNVTFAISNPQDGQSINVRIVQDATGSRIVTWPSSFRWAGSIVPVLSTAANAADFLAAQYDATDATWVATLLKSVQ
jgi:hypothetical protein